MQTKHVLISAMSGALMAALICALSLGSGPLPWLSGELFGTASASQNSLMSPTTGTVSGLQLTNNYNNALDSVNTMNSGASAPTNQLSGTPSLGNWWLNSTASPYPAQVYDGANWLAPFYVDATNHVLDMQMGGGTATVASATTVDLCSGVPQNSIAIAGAITITSFGSTCPAGVIKLVTFSGSLLLTYNATSLIIPGAANVNTSAGDQAVMKSLGAGNWQVVAYTLASGQALINPAIDVGDYILTAAVNTPSSKYQLAAGQAVSRTTYPTLLSNLTIVQSVTSTNGSPTLTGFSDTTQIRQNAVIEASFLSGPSYIVSCTSTTCTMANNANASTTANATIFPYGDGCGPGNPCTNVGSNFNLPDCRGSVLAGRDNMLGTPAGNLTAAYYGQTPDALGAPGGSQNKILQQANLGTNWNFPFTAGNSYNPGTLSSNQTDVIQGINLAQVGAGSSGLVGPQQSGSNSTSIQVALPSYTPTGSASSNGSGTPLATIQPTITANCMIRVLSMLNAHSLPAVNDDDQLAAIDPRRIAA